MLTNTEVKAVRALFKEQLHITKKDKITIMKTEPYGYNGRIGTATTYEGTHVVSLVEIVNTARPVSRDFGNDLITEPKNVLKTVAHELTHCLQVNQQRYNNHSYAFNEIVAETTACFALGLEYSQSESSAYVWNYYEGNYGGQKMRRNETDQELVDEIKRYLPQIQDLLRKHGLLK